MKRFKIFKIFSLCILSLTMLASCGNEKETHELKYIEEKQATCSYDGNIAYYHCENCNQNFQDEKGEIPILNVVLPVTPHPMSTEYSYTKEYHYLLPSCEHYSDETLWKMEAHSFANGVCSSCRYQELGISFLPLQDSFVSAKYSVNKKTHPIDTLKEIQGEIKSGGAYRISGEYSNIQVHTKENVFFYVEGQCQISRILSNGEGDITIIGSKDSILCFDSIEAKGSIHLSHINGTILSNENSITGKDIQIENSSFVMDSRSNCIQGELVNIQKSNISMTTNGNGVSATKGIYIGESDLQISTHTSYVKDSPFHREFYGLKDEDFSFEYFYGAYGKKVGKYKSYAPVNEANGIVLYADRNSFNTVDLGKNLGIFIEQSSLRINSNEDGIFASYGTIAIRKSIMDMNVFSDCIRADGMISLDESKLNVKYCYEACEAAVLQFNKSECNVYSIDDGLEAWTTKEIEGYAYFKDCNLYATSYYDDGIDSQNLVIVDGGTITLNGSIDGEGIDSDNGCNLMRGEIQLVSRWNSTIYEGYSEAIVAHIMHFKEKNGTITYTLKDEANNYLFVGQLFTDVCHFYFSSDQFQIGKTYILEFSDGEEIPFVLEKQYTEFGKAA